MPMELEWTTELGKFFHKEIVWGKKGVHDINMSNWTDNWMDKCEH